MLYSPKIREEELKNKVAADFFAKYDCTDIIKDIDFAVKLKRPANTINFCNLKNRIFAHSKRLSAV
jgi:predicted site-specific integrase-resolvase